jgi:retron-type reverse transcriptase
MSCGNFSDGKAVLGGVLKLIRAFINAGVMEDGLVRPVDEGTPQGGPLSPILSNLAPI